jgi:colanic acid biosynthesis glycosyl transferase WcaI
VLSNRKTLLIFSQTFVPDPASVGQHMTDVAIEMARRGHRVRVYASARGYDDPTRIYPKRENLNGVEIRRLGLASFGKKTILIRVLGTASFMLQCLFIGLFTPRLAGIFFSTSPPMIGMIASIIHFIRRVPIAYWAMDLNPDQLIAMGKIGPRSFTARVLERGNRIILRSSSLVVALDRFMAGRLLNRINLDENLLIMPPWPHEEHLDTVHHEQNPFRIRLGLQDKFVIMYSGNHSPAHPLTTLLAAAVHFKNDPRIRFLFIGGGLAKKDVEAAIRDHHLTNVMSLPYQPLSELAYSLSAADVHVVSLGNDMVGIVHPCKIYGAMAVGRPILYFGPRPSHIADILDENSIGMSVTHGDVPGAFAAVERLSLLPQAELDSMGGTARKVLASRFSQSSLAAQFCDRLERALRLN